MRFVLLASVALALAGCSQGEPGAGDPSVAASAEAPVPAALPLAPVKEADVMGPIAGSWTYVLTVQGGGDRPSVTMPATRECLPFQLTIAQAQRLQAGVGASCSDYKFRQEGASIIGSYACTMPDVGKTTIEATITGDMSRAYTATMISTAQTPSPDGPNPTTMILAAEREGDCPSTPPPPPLTPDTPSP